MTVELINLSAGYDRHPVVHHLSGRFAGGAMTGVMGPNGGGKSTLLKTLAGFMPLMSGKIDFGGLTRDQIAYLPQQFEIDRTFPINVIDVIQLGHWPRIGALGRLNKNHKDEAMQALAQVDMEAFADRPIISLSTGQWQRVLFARLSLQRAQLLLLDEPFAAIDERTTQELLPMLKGWASQGKTILCVMHDFNLVRAHFEETLILARDLVGWGKTNAVMNEKNLARASALAGQWSGQTALCDIREVRHAS